MRSYIEIAIVIQYYYILYHTPQLVCFFSIEVAFDIPQPPPPNPLSPEVYQNEGIISADSESVRLQTLTGEIFGLFNLVQVLLGGVVD